MKKILSLSVATALAIGFAACSSEDVPAPTPTPDNATGAYVQVKFTIPTTTSREASEYTADGAESSGVYALGTEKEYHINNVYLYFYSEDGAPVIVDETNNRNYVEWPVNAIANNTSSTAELDSGATGNDASANKGRTYQTTVRQLPSVLNSGEKYHVYALINKPVTSEEDISSEEKLLESKQTYSATDINDKDGNLPMTARSYSGQIYDVLLATAANNINNPAELSYEVERSYARVAFANNTFKFDLLTYNTENADERTIIGEVQLTDYILFNKNTSFYTYRHVGDIEYDNGYTANLADLLYDENNAKAWAETQTRFGRMTDTYPYVIEPSTTLKTTSSPYTTDYFNTPLDGIKAADVSNTLYTTDDKEGPSIEYIAENTMTTDAQRKAQTTGILFKAKIKPTKYEDSSTMRDGDSFYYYDGKFYKEPHNIFTNATPKNFKEFGIRYFKEGIGYYEYYIRHLNNGDNTLMGKMEFAIVRNNSYELTVTGIAMSPFSNLPGDPEPTDPDDPWDDDIPNGDEPDEGAKMYMQVNVTVRPWIVRTNSMTLGH